MQPEQPEVGKIFTRENAIYLQVMTFVATYLLYRDGGKLTFAARDIEAMQETKTSLAISREGEFMTAELITPGMLERFRARMEKNGCEPGKRSNSITPEHSRIHARVYKALSNSLANGNNPAAMPLEDLVLELFDFAAALEGYTMNDIRPHVVQWLKEHNK